VLPTLYLFLSFPTDTALIDSGEQEGVITCAVAVAAYVIIIDFPDKLLARRNPFLTAPDVELIKARIDRDRGDSEADPLTWGKVWTHLSDWKLWV
jgi:hypothetical protein